VSDWIGHTFPDEVLVSFFSVAIDMILATVARGGWRYANARLQTLLLCTYEQTLGELPIGLLQSLVD
jgi:hypothetical protein